MAVDRLTARLAKSIAAFDVSPMHHALGPAVRKHAVSTVLDGASEDFLGFYEVIWSISTSLPSLDPDSRIEAAVAAADSLLDSQRIEVFLATADGAFGEPLSAAEAQAAVRDYSNWSKPESLSTPAYWFAVTNRQ